MRFKRLPRGCVPVPGLSYVAISRTGNVWSRWVGRKLTAYYRRVYPQIGRKRYPVVTIHRRQRLVHILVATTFHGPCPAGQLCRHKNGDRANYAAKNLVWGTPLENSVDRRKHGRHVNVPKGASHPQAKLTDEYVRNILRQYERWQSQFVKTQAKRYDVTAQTIAAILAGRAWKHIKLKKR